MHVRCWLPGSPRRGYSGPTGLGRIHKTLQYKPEFFKWWICIIALFPEDFKRGLNSLIILGAWILWKHCNNYVFNGAIPNIQLVFRNILEEAQLWCIAGAKGLARLVAAR